MPNVKEGECMSDFYTVSQYLAIFGKDSGNIRRILINGTDDTTAIKKLKNLLTY